MNSLPLSPNPNASCSCSWYWFSAILILIRFLCSGCAIIDSEGNVPIGHLGGVQNDFVPGLRQALEKNEQIKEVKRNLIDRYGLGGLFGGLQSVIQRYGNEMLHDGLHMIGQNVNNNKGTGQGAMLFQREGSISPFHLMMILLLHFSFQYFFISTLPDTFLSTSL